ncbi:ABC transporter substrate-binding protein [Pseudonocardia sp. DSM 110487]|uniref:ABC transporter substrate-binding protein n=1 Tax=Pseudonocardia sp. DSM 110487 TaxID=2865833 RepID=UPI001C69CBC6|nr:ABC transporter substrate-binding protein [Pseudonocardia sp. DSM 110487]QYN37485.1 ABC transporter substrate-binding protein [Pseudonocardia sp. DSM 110487]
MLTPVLALLVVAACGGPGTSGSGATGAPQTGGTLAIGIESEVDVLDPQRAGGWVSWRVNRQMFEPLVDEDLSKPSAEVAVPPLRPGLAESWDISPDGTVYTFHIRPNVTFHDGTPLDAAAVEFNIRRMWDSSFEFYDAKAAAQTTFVWQYLGSVSTPDPMTVQLTMKQPFEPLLRLFAQGGSGSTGIMSPAAIRTYGNDDVAEHPAGTGPFRFAERVRGQRITLERNDAYWGQKPYLDKVVFRPLPDPSARVAALRADEVDMIAVPPPDSVQSLKDSGFQISDGVPPHVWYLSFNFADPIMSNKLVRQAINLAIDRQGMATTLLRDTVEPAYDVQAPANAAYVENTAAYGYDPDRAKQLLAEAGYPDGFETTMMTSVDGSGQIIPVPMAEYIQQDLAKVGIRITLDTTEWISYLSKWAQGTPAGVGWAQQSWGMTTPYWLYIATSSSLRAPNGPNVGGYSNPELDQVMAQAITTTSEEQAVELWKQANRIVTDDAAIAPVVNDKAPYVLSADVQGFVSASEEWYDLNTVWLS